MRLRMRICFEKQAEKLSLVVKLKLHQPAKAKLADWLARFSSDCKLCDVNEQIEIDE